MGLLSPMYENPTAQDKLHASSDVFYTVLNVALSCIL